MIRFRHASKQFWVPAALIALVLGALGAIAAIRQPAPRLSVVSAQVPFYPPDVQGAHIEGVVELRNSTDGVRPISVERVSGQPMLSTAAIQNVKTWVFEHHEPTSFQATFRYRLLDSHCDSACNCGSAERPNVVLRLPTEVEISAEEALICDPSTTPKH